MNEERPSLWLGRRADDDRPVSIDATVLLRHAMALGSSGSGKTVFCKVIVEEAVRRGIPAICIDPQGDLCSLASGMLDPSELAARGIDPALASELAARAEVVVLTPGSSRGVHLCADPVDGALADLRGSDRVEAVSRTAAMVAALLGFDLDSDDGAGLAAVVDRALHELIEGGSRPSLATLTERLDDAGGDERSDFARYLDPRTMRLARQRLARLDVGARTLLFHGGVPIDAGLLLGRDPRAPVAPGKTRIAIVYLNTLHQQEDKDFFVAALAERLHAWMLQNPSSTPQALFYIDEISPFVPPVRKPACKEGLSLLFKQARKYGVCCLMATQNPGDVDYKAMAQFGTWALGRLTTRQDLKKIEPTVKSLAPDRADAILARLPALKPGELVLISPDALDEPVEIRARWLFTRHETWTEERIEAYSEGMRARFAPLIAGAEPSGEPPEPSEVERDEPPARVQIEAQIEEDARSAGEPGGAADEVLLALQSSASASARELADRLGRSEGVIRRALERLVAAARVRSFKDGRSSRFWALSHGARPDLGIIGLVRVLVPHVSADDAERIGASHVRTRLLGVLGEDERFERVEPLHRLVYRLEFEEKVERPLFLRMFGPSHDERMGSVYLHPHNLGVLVFTNADGIRFEDVPAGPASEIRDFDGVTEIAEVPPATLALEEDDWTLRKPEALVQKSFSARFHATPGRVDTLFVPLWQVLVRSASGSLRRVTIDALIGRPVRWLPAKN